MKIGNNKLFDVNNNDINNDGTFIIPSGITKICDYAFYKCTSLTNIDIPESVTIIGEDAFSNCESLKEVHIPNGIKKINNFTFDGCKKLTNINIPDSIMEIGRWAFSDCEALETISIPNNFIRIDETAFSNCRKLILKMETSLYSDSLYIIMICSVKKLIINDIKANMLLDINLHSPFIYKLKNLRREELHDKIKKVLLDNKIRDKECFKYIEHKEFIEKIINNLETIKSYDYRMDFNNYINDYINKHKENISIEDLKLVLEETKNIKDPKKLTEYPYIISSLLNKIQIEYNKNPETINLKKVLAKLTKIELNDISDFVKLIQKVFFDIDSDSVVVNKLTMDKLLNFSKEQIDILSNENNLLEILKEIIREYFKKEKKLNSNLKDVEICNEELYSMYEQITNIVDFNFSCIFKLKEITIVLIPSLISNYTLPKIILKRKEEIEKLQDICNTLTNMFEVKEVELDNQNVKK